MLGNSHHHLPEVGDGDFKIILTVGPGGLGVRMQRENMTTGH